MVNAFAYQKMSPLLAVAGFDDLDHGRFGTKATVRLRITAFFVKEIAVEDGFMRKCVGLFGTCGGSMWRQAFKERLDALGIPWYDPQVMPETHGRQSQESDMVLEKDHFQNDAVLLIKITGETTGTTSLLEVIAVTNQPNQFVVVQIDDLVVDQAADFSESPSVKDFVAKIEEILGKKGFKFGNPIEDATRCRCWVRKTIEQHPSPLVVCARNDDEAMSLIEKGWTFIHGVRLIHLSR